MSHWMLPLWRITGLSIAALALAGLGACTLMNPSATSRPVLHVLDSSAWPAVPVVPVVATVQPGKTLIVESPRAVAGLDSRRMRYTREPFQVEHFAQHAWLEPPAQMLGPLVVQALRNASPWRTVLLAPQGATGDALLSLEITQLQHNFQFQPSRVQLTLRAHLTDAKTRRVMAWRDIRTEAIAPADAAAGGVVAANRAVQQALQTLAAFVSAEMPQGSP